MSDTRIDAGDYDMVETKNGFWFSKNKRFVILFLENTNSVRIPMTSIERIEAIADGCKVFIFCAGNKIFWFDPKNDDEMTRAHNFLTEMQDK